MPSIAQDLATARTAARMFGRLTGKRDCAAAAKKLSIYSKAVGRAYSHRGTPARIHDAIARMERRLERCRITVYNHGR